MGFWWGESQPNHLWNQNSPWYFKRHFASQIPKQNQFRFDIFPRHSMGFWWAESQPNHLWNPNSPWYFKRHFASQIPIKVRLDLTFSLEIPWDFGEQKAKQIISETQIPLSISKDKLKEICNFQYFFISPTHFILQCKTQNANQKCKPNKKFKVFSSVTILKIFFSFASGLHFASDLQFSIFFYFSNPLYFAVQNAKRKPKVQTK